MRILKVKIPLYVFLISMVVCTGVFYSIKNHNVLLGHSFASDQVNYASCKMEVIRRNDLELIRPLLFANVYSEDPKFKNLKEEVITFIDHQKLEKLLDTASVYLYSLDDSQWMSINDGELYNPGSLIKVPILITYLEEVEKNPDFLNKKIIFPQDFRKEPEQTHTGPSLKRGQIYSIKQLLHSMIVYSDNYATALLNANIHFETLQKLFSDLHLPVPDIYQREYLMNVSGYSRFFRILYNASYLDHSMSQYALKLLTETTYKEGMVKGMGSNIKIAHKFGEKGGATQQELHEFGIVYLQDKYYLLGIMTKGKNYSLLPQTLSGIAKIIYESIKKGA